MVSSITYNLEGISIWRKSDVLELEKIQAKLQNNPETTRKHSLLGNTERTGHVATDIHYSLQETNVIPKPHEI